MNGHCQHCVPVVCCGGVVRGVNIPHENGEGANWTGNCPACAAIKEAVVGMRKRAAKYRETELTIATTEPHTPGMNHSRMFFQGAAEALEWTLADIAGDRFSWIGGDE